MEKEGWKEGQRESGRDRGREAEMLLKDFSVVRIQCRAGESSY